MAQQKSILKLKGTIGGITFYKSKDGYLAREKGGVDASRIANDPGFARTRENGAEFSNAASAGKLLRDAVRVLGKDASDGRVTARLTQVMAQIKNMDEANARGERHVGEGMAKDEAKALLNGFNFNENAVLGAVLYTPFSVDAATGEIKIVSLNPQNDISLPSGASHVVLKSGFASINFLTGESEMTVSAPVRIATNAAEQAVSLKPATAPAIEGTHFYLLSIDFVQSVNNADYSLNNNSYNVLAIVGIE
ncbi:MAG: hypothetical protein A2W86_00580 [Bacteroidetes bacterium GWD2_45_23]|nr:MAG: hypothetical protein A2W87_05100 [Bacteroidetes bacterium GWC2_46_850]OFX66902.1 MAG: hypothetical protein A2071_04460 [Bacteroidetes bacterium GWC1_47_7]OFX86522.1 MAG: hypothetical protein A2W86_00580 [Bacteroidetes bacterium GWD2_45_23]HBB00094.1 hypothetical protein [Porphyromonadaceae bacterium]HCC17027.1 hypothetical protein [Porphyromonadaceae bacterium]